MVLQVETKFNEEKTDLQEESKEDEELKNLTHNLNYLGSLEKSEYLFVDENLDIQCKYSKGWWKTLDNDQKKNMTKLSSKCIKHCLESIKEKKY